MTIKKEYMILAIVIVALALYLLLGRQGQPGSDLPKMAALDNTVINRMVITKGGVGLTLAQKDDRWFITPNDYPVDRFKIKNMVKAAAELTLTARVSESGKYERYDLNDDKRIKVQIFNEDQITREFDIGRAAPTVEHTFVLVTGDTSVYHAKGRLNNTFELTIDALRDKTVLSFDKTTIASLQIQKGDVDLILTKTETMEDTKKETSEASAEPVKKTLWQLADGSAASQPAINSLINVLSELKCDAYMADEAKSGLTDALWTLTLKNDDTEHTVSLYTSEEKDAARYPGVSSFNDFAFLLSKIQVENIEKQINIVLGPTEK